MKKFPFWKTLIVALFTSACALHSATLFAQSVPATLKVEFPPRPASENVLQYKITLDPAGAATQVILQASACTATLCTANVTVPTFGAHVVTVVPQNQDLSGADAVGQLQDGPTKTSSFTLNPAPGQSGNIQIKK